MVDSIYPNAEADRQDSILDHSKQVEVKEEPMAKPPAEAEASMEVVPTAADETSVQAEVAPDSEVEPVQPTEPIEDCSVLFCCCFFGELNIGS